MIQPRKPNCAEYWIQNAREHGYPLNKWQEIDPLIYDLYQELQSATPIGEIFGVHRQTILIRLHRMGAKINTRGGKRENTGKPWMITINGIEMALQDWAKHTGISAGTLRYRFKHWSYNRAISQPVRKHTRKE